MNTVQIFLKKHWFWTITQIGALFPLAWLIWDYSQGNLSFNPIADITSRTGKAALVILLLSLACTPANTIFGFRQALTVRKSLGLYAFLYAGLHLLNFVGLDYGFNWKMIFGDAILTKRFIVVGLSAFLILLPLAITSTKGWMKRMGRNWKRLHQLVYVAGILAVIHFLWLVKAARFSEPVRYAVILAFLLIVRLPVVRRWISMLRQRFLPAPTRKPERKPRITNTQLA